VTEHLSRLLLNIHLIQRPRTRILQARVAVKCVHISSGTTEHPDMLLTVRSPKSTLSIRKYQGLRYYCKYQGLRYYWFSTRIILLDLLFKLTCRIIFELNLNVIDKFLPYLEGIRNGKEFTGKLTKIRAAKALYTGAVYILLLVRQVSSLVGTSYFRIILRFFITVLL